VLKVDLRNAFNTVSRESVLAAVAQHFSVLLPYALAAYGAPTSLLFGDSEVASSSGVQQGDPLGPLFFALALAGARRASGEPPELELEGWYLDDGVLGAPAAAVRSAFDALASRLAAVGLVVNPRKCEVV